MAFLLNKTALSALRLNSQKSNYFVALSRRGFHVEPGLREKTLLVAESYLKRFKSHVQGVRLLKVVGDILTVVVVAGMFILSQK